MSCCRRPGRALRWWVLSYLMVLLVLLLLVLFLLRHRVPELTAAAVTLGLAVGAGRVLGRLALLPARPA